MYNIPKKHLLACVLLTEIVAGESQSKLPSVSEIDISNVISNDIR